MQQWSLCHRARPALAQSAEERELSATMQAALEPVVQLQAFPKAVLDVYCTVLEAGGSELAAAVTAAAMAVADAGIEMVDLSPACSVVRAARRRMPRLRVCACVPQGCGTSDASPPPPPPPVRRCGAEPRGWGAAARPDGRRVVP